ncbi:MAG: IgGFc-binding protein, partial [Bacteroidales bacterium]|nr:IgGFc-binding protein [Bacteroidales bacterium]
MTPKRLTSTILTMLLAIPSLQAQLDTEFWFAIPEVNRYHQTGKGNCPCNDGTPTRFRITTLDRPVTVTISMPANEANFNGGNPLVINIPANSLYKLDLAPYISDEIQKQHPENPNYQAKVSMENKLRWCQSNYPGNGRNQYINRNNKGILIQSTDFVNIYYEISLINNKELLTLKGKNALGNKFFVPFQMNWNITDGFNHPNRPYRAFDIVATENNTHVRITIPNELAIYTINNSAKDKNNKPIQNLKNKIYDIYLNRGETAIIAPYASRKIDTKWNPSDLNNESTYQTERVRGKQLIGAKVEVIDDEGYKKIAIQTHEDMVNSESKLTGGKSVDYVADQLVNFECLGTDYAVIKGHAEDGFYYSNEYVIAIATENNTKLDVWFDNNNSISYNLNESEWKSINIPANANVATLQATKPIVVFHQSGVGIQFAGAVVPTISRCTGSTKVAFNRTMAKLDKTQNICQYPMCPGVAQITEGCKINGKTHECTGSDFHLFLNILVYKGAEDGFKLLRNGVDVTATQAPILLPANANTTFKDLPNANGNFAKYRYARLHLDALDQDVAYTLVNTKNVFHLGVINGRGAGMIIDGQVKTANSDAFYGYFSDFAEIKVDGTVNGLAGDLAKVCYGDVLRLYAQGGTTY